MSDLSVGSSGAAGNLYSNIQLNPATPVNKIASSDNDSAKTALATLAQNTASGLLTASQPQQTAAANSHLLASHVEQVAQARSSGDVTGAQKLTGPEKKVPAHHRERSAFESDSDSDDEPMPLFYSAAHGQLNAGPPPGQWLDVKI